MSHSSEAAWRLHVTDDTKRQHNVCLCLNVSVLLSSEDIRQREKEKKMKKCFCDSAIKDDTFTFTFNQREMYQKLIHTLANGCFFS